MAIAQEILELESVISALDTLYEQGDDCIHPITKKIVSDKEYDALRRQLETLHPSSNLLKTVTASKVNSPTKKVVHNPPMVSISKAIGTLDERNKSLETFISDIKKELGYKNVESELVQAYKRDGVAIALYYEEGKLVRAGLRPRDGTNGEDVTENVKYVEGVPSELWEHDSEGNRTRFLPVTCSIRGELECKKSVFRKIQADWQNPELGLDSEPKNPRNYTSGSIRQFNDPKITKHRKISFTGYSIVAWSSKDKQFSQIPFRTEIERAKYSNARLRIPFVQVRPFRYNDLKTLEDICNQLDYEVDGAVISVNNLEDSEQMGTHGGNVIGNPKSKIAWKFEEESVVVEVDEITWNPGRSGKLTPVLSFDGVILDGTTVSQCTGHSLGFLDGSSKASLGVISRGAKVKIIKSGKIIPKVIEVISAGRYSLSVPHSCPSCSQRLHVRQGNDGKDLVCVNEFCGERAVAKIVHYLSTLGVKGIGESVIKSLIEKDLIKDQSDLYELNLSDLAKAGLSPRESRLFIARLFFCPDPTDKTDDELTQFCKTAGDKPFEVPASQLFASLGIPGAGRTSGQILISEFKNFREIQKATLDELLSVDGLGEISSKAIIEFFSQNQDMIDRLLEFMIPVGKKIGKLSGKTFVFSGGFEEGKQFWENKTSEQGGTISNSVGKNTSFLVVGTAAGSKLDKAKQLGISILSLEDLKKML